MSDTTPKANRIFCAAKIKVNALAERYPIAIFLVGLALLVMLLIVGNNLRKPEPKTEVKILPKKVSVYRVGETPKARFQATIEKTGVVTITSLTGGIVSNIWVIEGDVVKRGQNIATLSSNFQGGNAFYVQRQLAQNQKKLTDEQYTVQKDIIAKQRDILSKNADNSEEIRKITQASFADTESIINLNNDVIKMLDEATKEYVQDNGPTVNDSTMRGFLSQKSSLQSANLSLNSSLRSNKYNENRENPPKKLEDMQRDIAQKQLDLQEKTLEISKSIASLQLSLAYIQESLMYPSSPFSGQIQKVYIKVGQAVAPGTPIALISQSIEDDPATAIVYVPRNIAEKISMDLNATVFLSKGSIQVRPSFVTTEAVQGSLFAVYLPIPDELVGQVSDKSVLEVDLPVGREDSSAAVPFVPLTAVSQTQTGNYIFVIDKGNIAKAINVTLGSVIGDLVEVKSGLSGSAKIILNQTITAGEKVEIQQ